MDELANKGLSLARAAFELTGRQKTLAEALSTKDSRLVAMYVGALVALETPSNPDSLGQACHSLRELMEKVSVWYASVPAPDQLPSMNPKVRDLENKWKKMLKTTTCLKQGNWGGEIDARLRAWLKRAEEFFAWLETDRPERNRLTTEMFRKLDPTGLPLPAMVEDRRLEEWSSCRDLFVAVAHHRIAVEPERIRERISIMEQILLDLTRPPTFEKHVDIDAIIEGGEGNANP